MLQSPGIQFFEKTVTPATATVTDTNGVATIGFSTMGPINKLVRVTSASEFNNVFGGPTEKRRNAHILASSVLAQGSPVYFMRIADSNAAAATCPVINGTVESAQVIIKALKNDSTNAAHQYLYAKTVGTDSACKMTISIAANKTVEIPLSAVSTTDFAGTVFGVRIADAVTKLTQQLGSEYTFTAIKTASAFGILVKPIDSSKSFTTSDLKIEYTSTETAVPTACIAAFETSEEFAGITPRVNPKKPANITDNYHFVITAKDSGSGMNDVRVIKTTNNSSVSSVADTWTVIVQKGNTILEQFVKLTPENFVEKINKSEYIRIKDEVVGTVETDVDWLDGTYVLGKGQLLEDGNYFADSSLFTGDYAIVSGTDGYPSHDDSDDEDAIVDLFIEALGQSDFVNCDANTFSILATPDTQEPLVQNAAISVCQQRGDAIYLVDTRYEDSEIKKAGIAEVVEWANGGSPNLQNSYAAVYYGWYSQVDPYNSSRDIVCPASVYVAPKMVALDKTAGEFYAPAGAQNGVLTVSDYIYSPDAEDRDKMIGGNNIVNPIIYSNTRGVMIMSQKTADRTSSPLNRVGIRRMTNAIKRDLRVRLNSLLFQPNNEYSRNRARRMVSDVLGPLQSGGMIEDYTVDVQSGTGANRNDLNVYLNFRPFGLIEFIYVYVSITDAGIEVTEATAQD